MTSPQRKQPGQRARPAAARNTIPLNNDPLTLDQLEQVHAGPIHVSLDPAVWDTVDAGAKCVEQIAAGADAAYGINTGFGSLCRKRIPGTDLRTLQTNLILSHAVGVGPPAPPEIVRMMMLLKIKALTHGYSGISRATLETLMRMLDADALPVIPTQGSLGASGDLAPLAHMVLPMIGHGEVDLDGRRVPAKSILSQLGMDPITLGPKEGLALINGTQFMAAYGAAIAIRARRLAKIGDIVASMSLEGLAGSARPFDERLHRLRPHPGAIECAVNIRQLLADSEILPSHIGCDRVQDPYSLRCVPQVHGAFRDALRHACIVLEIEFNSVTDNPLVFDRKSTGGGPEVISGGLFHGEPLALILDYLAIGLSELGSISERRIYLLLSGIAELPVLLMRDTGLNSGLMLPQYTAAALVSENKGLCTPASVDSIPTSLGQEDHVSMGARAACKCLQVLENVETVLAIELFCAAQALDFRAPLRAGVGPRTAHALVRETIAHADADRQYGEDMAAAQTILTSGTLVEAVEKAAGRLV